MRRRTTFAQAGLSIALVLATAACSGDKDEKDEKEAGGDDKPPAQVAWEFVTRPDLTPPKIEVTWSDADGTDELAAADDLVFLGVKDQREKNAPMNGPVIVRADGTPVWVAPQGDTRWTYDVRVQEYDGEPVLTWWRGNTFPYGYGEGEWVLMDTSYREIATVTTPDTHADFHDATLTEDGTALLISYPVAEQDLTELGGPADGFIRGSKVYEVDVASGEVLLEWDMLDHVPLSDTETELDPDAEEGEAGTEDAPFDPFHINSVTEDADGGLLVSARNTHAIYKLGREDGDVEWILGGKSSDFELGEGVAFAWQHDAERQDDGTLTLFDNQAAPEIGEESRGLRLEVDTDTMTASVVTEYLPPDGRLSESQGNFEQMADGAVFIGWGSNPFYSLYTADGELLMDAELAGGISYRAYLTDWVGSPTEPPKFFLKDETAHVSWNGATEVDAWRFVAGDDEESATEVDMVPADAFEVSAEMPDEAYVAAQALDASGKVLATAEPGAWP